MAHRFLNEIPRGIEPATVYVSIEYATAVHLCPGCGRKVVTPFAPGSWKLIFDGETVSISPSIWNKAHGCWSHYWIDRDRLIPARNELEEQPGHGRRSGARVPTVGPPSTWLDRLRQRLHRVMAQFRLER